MDTVIVGRDAGPDSRSLENAIRYAVETYTNLDKFTIVTHDHDCGGALIKWNIVNNEANYGSKMRTRVDGEDIEFMGSCKDFVEYQSRQGGLQAKRLNEILVKLGKNPSDYEVVPVLVPVPPKDHNVNVGDLCISTPSEGVKDPKDVDEGLLLCMEKRLNLEVKKRIGDWYFSNLMHQFECSSDLANAYHVQSTDPYELISDIRAAVEVIGCRKIVILPPEDSKLKAVFEDFAKELEKTPFIVESEIKVEVAERRSKSIIASAPR